MPRTSRRRRKQERFWAALALAILIPVGLFLLLHDAMRAPGTTAGWLAGGLQGFMAGAVLAWRARPTVASTLSRAARKANGGRAPSAGAGRRPKVEAKAP